MELPPTALPLLKFSPLPPQTSRNAGQSPSPVGLKYELLTHNFISVLKQVGDCPFAVICMSGNSRIGKSFTLNYFIRHLSGNQDQEGNSTSEFKWRKGTERETIGINLWSHPFFTTYKRRQIAILLMDAQGLFDPYTTLQQNSIIFALCSLFSSVGIFNLLKKLQADTLQNVNFFTQYSRAIGHKRRTQGHLDDDSEGFQRLVIMVRDFDDDDEYGYGYHDHVKAPLNSQGTCKNYFQDTLLIGNNANIPYEYKAVVNGILGNYESIGIILHPDPGRKFRQNPVDNTPKEEYTTRTKDFVKLILSDKYLIPKKIEGVEISGVQFIPYVEHLGVICKNSVDTFPPAQTIAESASIMSFNLASTSAYHKFLETVSSFMSAHPNATDTALQGAYEKSIQAALGAFHKIKTIGGKEKETEVKEKLLKKCKGKFDSLKESYCLKRDLEQVKQESIRQTELHKKTEADLKSQKQKLEEQDKESKAAIYRLTCETAVLNLEKHLNAFQMKNLEKQLEDGKRMQTQTINKLGDVVNTLTEKLDRSERLRGVLFLSGVTIVNGNKPDNSIKEVNGLNTNMNHGFGGENVYLVPKRTADPSKGHTQLKMRFEETKDPYSEDLAEGAVGLYRYLNLTRVHNSNDLITEVGLWRTTNSNSLPSNRGWKGWTQNINHGRGGDYLYVCWKTTSIA